MVSGKLKILLAERDPSTIEELRGLLEASYQIDVASDGLAVLQLAAKLQPDLIITAILLPKLDGFQLCRDLKAGVTTADIPILVCSSLLAETRIRQAGADAFLSKPVDRVALRQAIDRLVGRSRRRGQ
ncbi:MAG: response regulator [Chloroflexi bacterium]|nr:response regulator [Chloroflexota bacterium]